MLQAIGDWFWQYGKNTFDVIVGTTGLILSIIGLWITVVVWRQVSGINAYLRYRILAEQCSVKLKPVLKNAKNYTSMSRWQQLHAEFKKASAICESLEEVGGKLGSRSVALASQLQRATASNTAIEDLAETCVADLEALAVAVELYSKGKQWEAKNA
ncbi:hypothetical protein ETAA8_68370 [Anatilimnocola aggregata]|uniref:Uncharacterized protein n=1 Tax=Anatilimnocola aggregata TaxID=2528021 RepID=A0A517YN70_9BACT|nr:hypothetical protein [Anatilimnocola aggregata]QDU31677.1 hypothetical protein ETAA8_68370 [Anatilimnocola aggregata]